MAILMAANNLKLSSYNCRQLPKCGTELFRRPDIVELFETCDLVFFQETWLAKQQLYLCNSLHEHFLACSVAKVDYAAGILHGRPSGGVSVFYRKTLSKHITPLYFPHCNWCVGIEVNMIDTCFTLINVYMPYESCDNDDEFIHNISILDNIIEGLNHTAYAIVGDWNANMKPINGIVSSRFGRHVLEFCNRNNLSLPCRDQLPDDSYTYVSERWGSTSSLDYIVASPDFVTSISDIKVRHDLTNADHIPVNCSIQIERLPVVNINVIDVATATTRNKNVNWERLNENDIQTYTTFTDLYCTANHLNTKLPTCNDCNCKSSSHTNMLTNVYETFTKSILDSSEKVCNVRNTCATPRTVKPGWNEYVKEKHQAAIDFYKQWRDVGKPRNGPFFNMYYRSKLNYKYAVRAIKRNEESIKADNLARHFMNNKYSNFWKSVKRFNNSKTVLPQSIDDAHGDTEICDRWKKHFKSIYNSVPDS